jgi:hypothetical protein
MILRYWFVAFCALAALAGAIFVIGSLSSYDGPSVESCEQIEWRTKPCEELDRQRMQETLHRVQEPER